MLCISLAILTTFSMTSGLRQDVGRFPFPHRYEYRWRTAASNLQGWCGTIDDTGDARLFTHWTWHGLQVTEDNVTPRTSTLSPPPGEKVRLRAWPRDRGPVQHEPIRIDFGYLGLNTMHNTIEWPDSRI
jgi:hypothetical protein